MTNVNQAPLPRLWKAPLVRASLVKRRYIKYLALPFFYALPLRGLLQHNQYGMNNQAIEDEGHPGSHQDNDTLLIDPFQGEEQPYLNDEGADVLMLQ